MTEFSLYILEAFLLPFPQRGGAFLLRFSPYGGPFLGLSPLLNFLRAPMVQEEYLVPWNFKIMGLPKDN